VQLHDLHSLCLSVAATGVPQIEEYPCCLTQANDPAWRARETVFSEFPRQSKTLAFMHDRSPRFAPGVWDCGMWAARSTGWRYIEYDNGQLELHNLRTDPGETTSIHEGHPEVCERFRAELEAHRNDQPYAPGRDEAVQAVDEVVAERLRALGYIE
jgi:hypothetical protein